VCSLIDPDITPLQERERHTLIEATTASLYERIELIVMEIPPNYERTVEVGAFAAKLAFVNDDAVVPIPPIPHRRVVDPPCEGAKNPRHPRLGFSIATIT
jgi:hypothetical protein